MVGRILKFLNVTDDYNRLSLTIRVGRRCRAAEVTDKIVTQLTLKPPPNHLQINNGPELIANTLQE